MKKNIFIILILFSTSTFLYCQSIGDSSVEESPMLRYRLTGLYEYFTYGDEELEFAMMYGSDKEDRLLDILSSDDKAALEVLKYQDDMSKARLLITISNSLILVGSSLALAPEYVEDVPSVVPTIGLITIGSGLITDVVGYLFLQSAKGALFDSVWEFNNRK